MKKLSILAIGVGLLLACEQNPDLSLAPFCEKEEYSKAVCTCLEKRLTKVLGQDAEALFKALNDGKHDSELIGIIDFVQAIQARAIFETCEKE